MPMTAHDATDLLLYRTRTAGGFTHSDTTAREILSLAQSMTQVYMRRLLKTVTFTLTPEKPIYDTTAEFADCYLITCIEDEKIHLSEAKDWHELSRYNSKWLRCHANKSHAFAQIGARFLAVYPTPNQARTVEVTFVHETAKLDEDTDALELPNEDQTFCLDLAEIALLLATARGNKLQEMTAKFKSFLQRVGAVVETVSEERDI